MRHNKLTYLFLLFSLTAAVPSCGFLDVVPPETEGPDDFLLDEDCERRDETARLRQLVDGLSGRQRQVVLLRYGLSGQPPMTQQEVADKLHISRSYVSRIEKKMLTELREKME